MISTSVVPAGVSTASTGVAAEEGIPATRAQQRGDRQKMSELTNAVMLSIGASCIVDRPWLSDWQGVMAVMAPSGPAEIIHRVRQAEARRVVAASGLGGGLVVPAQRRRLRNCTARSASSSATLRLSR